MVSSNNKRFKEFESLFSMQCELTMMFVSDTVRSWNPIYKIFSRLSHMVIFSFDISTSQEKMSVVIIPVVIATWEAILLHTLETQRETRL